MPQRMKQLAWVQMFTWGGLFCMWTYFSPAVARHVFGATDPKSELYTAGTNWGGVCFSVYNGVALAMAFLLMGLVRKISPKTLHSVGLLCGAVGLLSVLVIKNKYALFAAGWSDGQTLKDHLGSELTTTVTAVRVQMSLPARTAVILQ